MKKFLAFLCVVPLILCFAGFAKATLINYAEDVSSFVPDNIWTDGEIYTFVGGLTLEPGTYDLSFTLGGTEWSLPLETAYGWELDDAIYIEALLKTFLPL